MDRCLCGQLRLGYWNFVGGEMTTLTFGKYKGWSVADVLDVNPSYILWAKERKLVAVDDKDLSDAIEQNWMKEVRHSVINHND